MSETLKVVGVGWAPSKTTPPPNPAKFSDSILSAILVMARRHDLLDAKNILDPFAGLGRVYEVFPTAVGVEIEPRWADACPNTICGDSLDLRAIFPRKRFDLAVTSPTYGNRMADHHNNQDPCKKCEGTGKVTRVFSPVRSEVVDCRSCKGTGLSLRHTYRHYYGEDLQPNNSGTLQWGPAYQAFHERAWASLTSVMKPGGYFILNVSDHIRNHRRQRVEAWHLKTLAGLGWNLVERERVSTPRQKHGANGEVRVASEGLFLLRLAS